MSFTMRKQTPADRLEYLRRELRAERISYGELSELQSLVEYIDPSDVELLEVAGVPEFGEEREQQARDYAAAQRANEPQPATPSDTSTPNGFDPALLAGINGVLSDRETGISLSDLSGDLWDNLIGPFFDKLEDAILDGDFDDDGIVTIDKTAAAYKGDE